VKHWPILIIFGTQHHQKKIDVDNCVSDTTQHCKLVLFFLLDLSPVFILLL